MPEFIKQKKKHLQYICLVNYNVLKIEYSLESNYSVLGLIITDFSIPFLDEPWDYDCQN